jgi:hypothetical protein
MFESCRVHQNKKGAVQQGSPFFILAYSVYEANCHVRLIAQQSGRPLGRPAGGECISLRQIYESIMPGELEKFLNQSCRVRPAKTPPLS